MGFDFAPRPSRPLVAPVHARCRRARRAADAARMTRTIRCRPCSPRCMKAATVCTTRATVQTSPVRCLPTRRRSACTRRRRGCGRTTSAGRAAFWRRLSAAGAAARRARRVRCPSRVPNRQSRGARAEPRRAPTNSRTTCTSCCARNSRCCCWAGRSRRPICRKCGARSRCAISASRPLTTSLAACRTSTGRSGSFGYFPSYTLGNLYAAMLWAQLRRDVADVDDALERGRPRAGDGWLRREVHSRGARETAGATIERVTGRPLTAASFLDYVTRKFGA